jgi:hypothetical protein
MPKIEKIKAISVDFSVNYYLTFMKKIVLAFVFIFSLGASLFSCFYDDTCDPVPPHFKILGLKAYNMRFTAYGDPFPWQEMNETVPIEWENYFLRLGFDLAYVSSIRSNFGNSLMALSCAPAGYLGDKIGVDTVLVKTIFDLNQDYPAGSMINEIVEFNIRTSRTDDFEEFFPLSDYLNDNKDGILSPGFEVKITEAPSEKTDFALEINYILNNGEIFVARSSVITMKI